MPDPHQWGAFLVATLLFLQVPGPSLLFTIGRALSAGTREALLTVVGNGGGLVLQAVLVACGLGALVAASATAYTVVKVVGALYVIHLGVQAIRHRAQARAALVTPDTSGARSHALRIGFTVGVTNPKTLVFFAAFLPQFTDPSSGSPTVQVALLGLVFGAMAVVSDGIWALLAGQARAWFGRRPQRLDRLNVAGGSMMVGLGALMLVRD